MFDRSDTCPHLPDLLSDRQERDFDSSDMYTVYVPLSSVQDKTKNLKRVYLIQTNKKTNTRTHVNQRNAMLTKTRN